MSLTSASFGAWWALASTGLAAHPEIFRSDDFRPFLDVARRSLYRTFFVGIGKVLDRDSRVAGLAQLGAVLEAEGRTAIGDRLKESLEPVRSTAARVLGIRHNSVAHNNVAVDRDAIYSMNSISANEIRILIDAISSAVDDVASAIGDSNVVVSGAKFEASALAVVAALEEKP